MSTVAPSKPEQQQAKTAAAEKNSQPQPTQTETTRTPNDLKRTMLFVAGAVACLGITAALDYSSRPAEISEFGRVGEQFYPEFADPTLATNLEVFVFDKDAVSAKEFQVAKLDNGRWVIPSHHNYPADAEQQLAETAASVIGIQRGAMVTRWEADHARYGVVNPKQESLNVEEVEGVGSRVILRQSDDSVLADYIIGNQVDGSSGEYYVRHPDEDEVYIASLDIDLSTKFTDWIETDLFDVSSSDIVQLTLNDYEFDELKGTVKKNDVSVLTREKSSEPWQLDGINADTEEVNKDAVSDTLTAIAGLSINGVRPKHSGLTPELTLNREVVRSQKDVDRVQSDLLSRGFLLQQDKDSGDLGLIAREGEWSAATDEGLIYRMYFGRAFTGSQEELEIGFADAGEEAAKGTEDPAKSDGEESSDAEGETDSDAANSDEKADATDKGKPGRYVFVRVDFDESLLEALPEKPIEPVKPAELVAAEEAASEASVGQAVPDESNDAAAAEEGDEAKSESTDSENKEQETQDDPLKKIREDYEAAKKKYDSDLATYERKLKDRERAIEDGQKKAKDLNDRFADWYYVIPGSEYDDLKLARADFVKEKETEKKEDETSSDEPTDSADKATDSPEEAKSDDVAKPDNDAPPTEKAAPANDSAPTETDSVNEAKTEESAEESSETRASEPEGKDTTSKPDQPDLTKQEEFKKLVAKWSSSILKPFGWR